MNLKKRRNNNWTGIVIDITPLIDVVFILLIFFLLTAAPSPEPELSVKLPSASASSSGITKSVKITINQSGDIFMNEIKINNLDLLKSELKKIAAINPSTKVILRGDKKMYYEKFISILEVVNSVNLPLAVAVKHKTN